MKKLLTVASAVALIVTANVADAGTYKGIGYGSHFGTALAQARLDALQQANGTWVSSVTTLDQNELEEKIAEYQGGVIKSYQIEKWDGKTLILIAEIDETSNNTVSSNKAKIDSDIKNQINELLDEQKRFNEAFSHIEDKESAFKIVTNSINFRSTGHSVIVEVDIDIMWQDKWISDSKGLLKVQNREGSTTYGFRNKFVGGVTNHLINNGHPIFAAIAGQAAWKDEEVKNSPMICFGTTKSSVANECFDSGRQLNFGTRMILRMDAMQGNEILFHTKRATENQALYEYIAPNTVKSHRNFKSLDMKYLQPTVAIYSEERVNMRYGLEIPSDVATKIDEFKFKVQ